MIGRRSTNMPTAAGNVSSAIRRMPLDVRSMKPAPVASRDGARHLGRNVVAIDIASSPWGSTKKMYALRVGVDVAAARLGQVLHDHDRDLVGDDVAERPRRQRQQPAHRRVAEVRAGTPADTSAELQRRQHVRAPSTAMPTVAPSPSVHRSRSFVSTSIELRLAAVDGRRASAAARDDDHVRQHGRPRRGEVPPRAPAAALPPAR